MSDQQPWQRTVRRPPGSLDWQIQPGVDTPRRYPVGPIIPGHPAPPAQPTAPEPTGPRTEWRPAASFGKIVGLLLVVVCAVLAVICLMQARDADGGGRIGWGVLALLFLACAFVNGNLLRGLFSMRYTFDREGLTISWMQQAYRVPFAEITAVSWEPYAPLRAPLWEPYWPGYYVSVQRTPDGVVHTWATQVPRRRIHITTSQRTIAISPERPILFLAELARRRHGVVVEPVFEPARQAARSSEPVYVEVSPAGIMTVTESHAPAPRRMPAITTASPAPQQQPSAPRPARQLPPWLVTYRRWFQEQLLHDQVASSLVAAGLVVPLVMATYLFSQYEGLLSQIPLHWDAYGRVDRVGSPRDLWRFPIMGLLLLLVNTALATLLIPLDRFIARVLTAATLVSQAVIFIALLRAMH